MPGRVEPCLKLPGGKRELSKYSNPGKGEQSRPCLLGSDKGDKALFLEESRTYTLFPRK